MATAIKKMRKIGRKINDVYLAKYDDHVHFNIIDNNRFIDPNHVMTLKKSLQTGYIPLPIIVNEHYGIIDGQHRFNALLALKYHIIYMMIDGLTLRHAITLNIFDKSWNEWNYANFYIGEGQVDYKYYTRFRKEFGVGHQAALVLLCNHTGDTKLVQRMFKEGLFEVSDYNLAVSRAKMIRKCRVMFSDWKKVKFIRTLIHLLHTVPEYDHDRFIKKIGLVNRELMAELKLASSRKQYLRAIEDIYNHKRHNKQVFLRLDVNDNGK